MWQSDSRTQASLQAKIENVDYFSHGFGGGRDPPMHANESEKFFRMLKLLAL